jgi:diguanylate cyclase (GGDEF)-like protein/PAS domain S-box-containing protein
MVTMNNAVDQSENRLRELMDNINDLIQSVAPDGTLLFANRVWYETLGYAQGEIANLFQIIHPESLSHCQALFQRVLLGENLECVDAVFVAKDGRRVLVEGSANCTFKDGKPVATNSIFRDVTVRKAAERERAQLQLYVDRSMEGIARLDNQGVYTYMNLAHAKIYGYTVGELIGKTWRELYTVEQAKWIEEKCFPEYTKDGKWRGVVAGRKKNGELLDVEVSLTGINTASGEFEGTLCTCADATERNRTERALRQSEQRFRSLFNSTYQFMGLLSVDGVLLEVNAPSLLIGGLSESDVVGKFLWDTHWFSHSESARTRLRKAIGKAAHGEFVRYEVAALATGNRTVMVDFSLQPVFDDAQRVVQIIPEGRDITVKYQLTEQLAASEQRLKLITDTVPALIGYMDRDRCYQFANKGAEGWFGIPQAEIPGQHVKQLLGADAYARAEAFIDRAFSGEMVTFENHRSDGRSANVTYIPDRQGDEVMGIYTFGTDVTERIQAAKNLYMERERARTTLGSIGDGVITINASERIDFLNPVAERLTGWKLANATGMRIETVLHLIDQSDGKPIESPLYHALATGEPVELPPRTLLISKDGSEYSVEDSCTPIRDSGGVVTGAVLVFRDVTDKRKMVDRITYQARHDALTGLVNRQEFERIIAVQLQDARDTNGHHAMLFLDLDQFKIVNDICGHQAGDRLLRQLSQLMLRRLRSTDILGRLGGDEFGVLLENCQLGKAEQIAKNLINEIGAFRFIWEDRTFSVGASIGIVPINRNSRDKNSLFVAADSACFWAKENGRNQCKVHCPESTALPDRQGGENWIGRITSGLDEDRFCAYAQRIEITDHTQRDGADSYEMLLRLREGDHDLVPPMAFLPAAERYSLMPQIDRWAIRHAFDIVQKKQLLNSDGHLSINLSSASLSDPTLLDFVAEQFRLTSIAPNRICFEIAEAAMTTRTDEASQWITALRALGCLVALDNFAGGLISFPYLKDHPVDYLKIDGRYIKTIAHDSLAYAMVDSINRMAHLLGIKTVAQSVENDVVLSKLKAIGVDFVQGYAVHEPQLIAQIIH